MVVCPDEATAAIVRRMAETNPQVRHLADLGVGKPAALNLVLEHVGGGVCVLTDGDVEVQPGAIGPLLAPFDDPLCGAVAGRPVSASPRSTMLGYWSHLLTDAADLVRGRRAGRGQFLDCSGYLYAVRREILEPIPAQVLADDAHISQSVWRQGCRIAYAPEARVAVRYPTTYRDWLLQKVRSTAGAATAHQEPVRRSPSPKFSRPRTAPMRSLGTELVEGLLPTLRYGRSFREHCWTLCLLAARLHLWSRVWIEVNLRRRSHQEIWQRVESTK